MARFLSVSLGSLFFFFFIGNVFVSRMHQLRQRREFRGASLARIHLDFTNSELTREIIENSSNSNGVLLNLAAKDLRSLSARKVDTNYGFPLSSQEELTEGWRL